MKISDFLDFDSDLIVSNLTLNSNEVVEGSVFIALKGANHHGLNYAKSAIEKGAIAILFDNDDTTLAGEILADINVLQISVENLPENLGEIAARFYEKPSQTVNVIGITGTNGKTSCSQFLAQTLENCGVIGTIGWGKYGAMKHTLNTTPDALAVQKMLATLKNDGCENVAMEVSSHGLAQGRVNSVKFKGAIFTNFSRDHLDYHGTMNAYLETKLKLFNSPELEFAVINLDEEVSDKIIAAIPDNVEIIGVTTKHKISSRGKTLAAENIELQLNGIRFDIIWQKQYQTLHVPLIGKFNLENVLCVLATMLELGIELKDATKRLTNLKPVAGRMEKFGGEHHLPLVIVDYAHTPDALEKVLSSLRLHITGNLGVVFGCGGNRDTGKRAEMGQIAEELADWVIITDDNPRFESNEAIVLDIIGDCLHNEAKIIHDRKKAIRSAIEKAGEKDCVLIAGKGHEDYQEINGEKFPFSDAQCVRETLGETMIEMNLSEIASCLDGELIGKDVKVTGIGIDSRTLKTGQLYIAIAGKNFDGHEFVESAKNAGSVAVLTHKKLDTDLPQILVENTHSALGKLAGAWRDQMDVKVVGVTGSNGKTTTKEMLAAILQTNEAVLFTQGNLNNDIGVPLTLLKLSPEHRYAVVEMGANHANEIAYTSKISKSDVVIITNVGAAHLEGFGDLNGVARAKGEIIETLNSNGTVVLNADDAFFDYWQGVAGSRKTISFGLNENADIRAENIDIKIESNQFVTVFDLKTADDKISIHLPLAGNHNVLNALAAAAATLSLSIPLEQIKRGLESMSPVNGRLQLLRGQKGNLIINDTYNANTSSLKAALDVLDYCNGEHWVILGAFGELGDNTEKLHFEMGETLKNYGVKRLFAVGELTKQTIAAFGENGQHFSTQMDLINAATPLLTGNETILIKGSRSQRMENVTNALIESTGI